MQSLALRILRMKLHRIVSKNLRMHLYKMQMVQKLEPTDHEQCMVFGETMLTMIVLDNFQVSDVLFSDEGHFNLHINANCQNMRYY